MPSYGILDGTNLVAEFAVPLSLKTNRPVISSDSLSLKRTSRRRPAQRWELDARVIPSEVANQYLMVHLIVNDSTEEFTIIVPQATGVIRSRTSVATPTAIGSLGSSLITIAGNAGIIAAGTFIRFSNHSKVYMLRGEINGNGSIGIYPELRKALPQGTTFKHQDDVLMNCTYDTDVVKGMIFDNDGLLMDPGVLKFIEAL